MCWDHIIFQKLVWHKRVFVGNRGLLITQNQIRYGCLVGGILRCVKVD